MHIVHPIRVPLVCLVAFVVSLPPSISPWRYSIKSRVRHLPQHLISTGGENDHIYLSRPNGGAISAYLLEFSVPLVGDCSVAAAAK